MSRLRTLLCALEASALTVTLSMPGIAGTQASGTAPATGPDAEGPTNVIYLVGDGMGFNQIDAGSLYAEGTSDHQFRADPSTGEIEHLPGEVDPTFADFPVQSAAATAQHGNSYDPEATWGDFAHSLESHTDSAAGATALASGVRTTNGAIGIDACGRPVDTLTDLAQQRGKSTGVVTSMPFNHATPAGFTAHDPSRNNYHALAREMILEQDLDVIMGAGHPEFDADGERLEEPEHEFLDERRFRQLSEGSTRFDYLSTQDEFEDLATAEETPERVFGLAEVSAGLQYARSGPDLDADGDPVPGAEPYEAPRNDSVPTLPVMAEGALNVLEEDEDGMFLMVEGGAIDAAAHQNALNRQIEEQLEFHDTIDTVVDWVERESSWEETLVVVTADHETGYLTGADSDPTWQPMEGEQGELPVGEYHTGGHSNALVPVFARGPGAAAIGARADMQDPVRGAYMDNIDIAGAIFEAWGQKVDPPGGADGDPAEELVGAGTEADPYQLTSWEDVELISAEPEAHYLLVEDLELEGTPRAQIACEVPEGFTGTFDGDGHEISGFAGYPEVGGGLFAENAGTIRDLAVTGAEITDGPRVAGILADINSGTIERSWTSGAISGSARVGGIAGNSTGVIRDSYSLADVTSAATEAGGIAGVGVAGSSTERVYAAGTVTASTNNAGGVVGYGYGGTVIEDTLALNPEVSAAAFGHAVLGRYSSGTPTLAGNHAGEETVAGQEGYAVDPAADNPKGAVATTEQTASEQFYAETLGWDFEETWEWDEELGRPTLQNAPER